MNTADADVDVADYLDSGTDFAPFSSSELTAYGCLSTNFSPGSIGPSNSTRGSGSDSFAVKSVTSTTTSAHVTLNTDSHRSASSYAESLDVELDLDDANVEEDFDVSLVSLSNPENVCFISDEAHSFVVGSAPVGEEEIEPWILALAAKPIVPDHPELVNHSSMLKIIK
jgi:hypothetical protein